ncbi:MAG: hypothetical protein MZV49_24330 [Rhodopseudomonas palustris]|nr:hypothetical protein [Rhodopseudomonas palustris]
MGRAATVEKVYSYGLNAFFTKKAMNPKDIKSAINMMRTEAASIDRDYMTTEGSSRGQGSLRRDPAEDGAVLRSARSAARQDPELSFVQDAQALRRAEGTVGGPQTEVRQGRGEGAGRHAHARGRARRFRAHQRGRLYFHPGYLAQDLGLFGRAREVGPRQTG